MHRIVRPVVAAAIAALALAGCSSSATSSSSSSSTAGSSGWSTPQDVLDGVTAAGFNCTLPSSDSQPQVLTKDPFTGKELGGHALIRCPDFQIMLAKGSVDDGFAMLVKCQTVPQSIRESKEWTVPVVETGNALILPGNLSNGWAATAQPSDFIKKFGGTQNTFGKVYDRACAGRPTPSGAASSAASSAPSASAS